jgi:hypothetical protein
MKKRFDWVYIIYLIISSFFLDPEQKNLTIHLLNIIPTVFLFYTYFQTCSKPYSIENYLVLCPLVFFVLSEIIIYLAANPPYSLIPILLNGIYFFLVHISFVFVYRMEGGRVLTFGKSDYYQTLPFVLTTFLVFGFVFLPIIPGEYIFLMMLITSTLAILFTHIVNRPIKGKSYLYGLIGGFLLIITDIFAGYSTFFLTRDSLYFIYRFSFFLSLFCMIESLLCRKEYVVLDTQK